MRKFISLLLAAAMVLSMAGAVFAAEATSFSDVAKSDYFYDAVNWAVENEITLGTGEGKFSPVDDCTRAHVVTFLWRAAGSPEPASDSNPFTDVVNDAASSWYYKAVLWAVDNEITTGTSATTFAPGAACTRAQIVTFLYRYAGKPEVTTSANPFGDVIDGVHDAYKPAILWAVENGITTGMGEGVFEPDGFCTRGQIVTFLYRYVKRFEPFSLNYAVETGAEVEVTKGITQLFTGNLHGLIMTVENVEDAVLTYGGQTYKADANGAISISFPEASGAGRNPVEFTIKNGSTETVSYKFTFVTPAGDMMNPAKMVIGKNTAALELGDVDGYYYTWTASEDGTLTIAMDQKADWSYTLDNLTAVVYGDQHTSVDEGEWYVPTSSIEVKAGDEIRLVVSTLDPADPYTIPAGTVVFTASFEKAGEQVEDTTPEETDPSVTEPSTTDPVETEPDESEPQESEPVENVPETNKVIYTVTLVEGSNSLTMSDEADNTVFEFVPEENGLYRFTVANTDAQLGYFGGNPYFVSNQTADRTNTLEFNLTQGNTYTNEETGETTYSGPSIMVGVKGITGSFTMTVTRVSDAIPEETIEYVMYENTHTFPEDFNNRSGSVSPVDVTDEHTAVLGDDGYYHLDSADGKILYVDFKNPANANLDLTVLPGGTAAETLRGSITVDGTVKYYDFYESHAEYIANLDGSYMYPLTDDLILFLKARGNGQGWYVPAYSPFTVIQNGEAVEDTAWMILCCC